MTQKEMLLIAKILKRLDRQEAALRLINDRLLDLLLMDRSGLLKGQAARKKKRVT